MYDTELYLFELACNTIQKAAAIDSIEINNRNMHTNTNYLLTFPLCETGVVYLEVGNVVRSYDHLQKENT
jgi:hypothetical protein